MPKFFTIAPHLGQWPLQNNEKDETVQNCIVLLLQNKFFVSAYFAAFVKKLTRIWI